MTFFGNLRGRANAVAVPAERPRDVTCLRDVAAGHPVDQMEADEECPADLIVSGLYAEGANGGMDCRATAPLKLGNDKLGNATQVME